MVSQRLTVAGFFIMSKELPYFKFETSEWDNGNIQMCSRETKGLFIDLCSIYWSRVGELPYALALQKHCNGNKDALKELENHDIIGVIEGQIIIEFLDEQLEEFQETSEKRRKAANKRWSDASALQVQSKSNAIREEESRVDEIREDETRGDTVEILENYPFEDFWNFYDKKVGSKSKVKKKYESCNEEIRKKIMEYLPDYILSTPDKTYRLHPATFLNNEGWESEIIQKKTKNDIKNDSYAKRISEIRGQ